MLNDDFSNSRWMDIDHLNIDRDHYQRPKSNALIKEICAEFNWAKFGFVTVGMRQDQSNWIIDGQQRTLAAVKMGELMVPCRVIPSTGPTFEAEIFRGLNKRHGMSTGTILRAELCARNPEALNMQKILYKNGFKFSFHGGGTQWPNIGAIAAVRSCYKRSSKHLDYVLSLIVRMWDGETAAISGDFIRGFSLFVYTYSDHHAWNEKTVLVKIGRYSPSVIVARFAHKGTLGGHKFKNIANGLAQLYNHRKRLDREKLPID